MREIARWTLTQPGRRSKSKQLWPSDEPSWHKSHVSSLPKTKALLSCHYRMKALHDSTTSHPSCTPHMILFLLLCFFSFDNSRRAWSWNIISAPAVGKCFRQNRKYVSTFLEQITEDGLQPFLMDSEWCLIHAWPHDLFWRIFSTTSGTIPDITVSFNLEIYEDLLLTRPSQKDEPSQHASQCWCSAN